MFLNEGDEPTVGIRRAVLLVEKRKTMSEMDLPQDLFSAPTIKKSRTMAICTKRDPKIFPLPHRVELPHSPNGKAICYVCRLLHRKVFSQHSQHCANRLVVFLQCKSHHLRLLWSS